MGRVEGGAGGNVLIVAGEAFIGEEEKQLVLRNGSAEGPAELAKIVVYAGGFFALGAVEFIEGIPIGVLILEKAAAVELIGAALGDDFDLGAGAAAIFG